MTRATLSDAGGHKVALPAPPPSPGDDDGPGDRVTIALPAAALKPGAYRLEYRVLAADGHATPGLLRFTVSDGGGGDAGAGKSPVPAPILPPATRPAKGAAR